MKEQTLQQLIRQRLTTKLPMLLASAGLMGLVSVSLGGQVVLLRLLVDDVWSKGREELVAWIPALLVTAYLLQAAAEAGRGILLRRAGLELVAELRLNLFDHAQSLQLRSLELEASGVAVSRIVQEPEVVQRIVTLLLTIFQKPLSLVVLLGSAYLHQPRLTLLVLLLLPMLVLPLYSLSRLAKRTSQHALADSALVQARVHEAVMAGRMVRAFQLQSYMRQRLEPVLERWLRSATQAVALQQSAGPLVQAVVATGIGCLIWSGSKEIVGGIGSAGSLLSFLVSLGMMYDPLKSIAQLPVLWAQARASLERMELWWQLPCEPDTNVLTVPSIEHGREPLLRMSGLSYRYAAQVILDGVSLTVSTGEIVALVGRSGSGKSTLMNCLSRILDDWGGEAELAGEDLHALSLDAVRAQVALVEQNPILLEGTIEENVRLGRHLTHAELQEALTVTSLYEGGVNDIPALGPSRQVGEGGRLLSGGQRQRVAIARALAGRPKLLLLDEATSGLDTDGEHILLMRLKGRKDAPGVLMCSHRRSAIWEADRVLVLDEGRIVEEGDAETLSRSGRVFPVLLREGTLGENVFGHRSVN